MNAATDDDAALLASLSDRDVFERVLARCFGLDEESARAAAANVFYHYMDPWGRLLDRVVDEGDSAVFSREDRRDLVRLTSLGVVAVRSTEVVKLDVRGREKVFTQYHYALHLDAIRQRLVEAAGANLRAALAGAPVPGAEEDESDERAALAPDVYADPSLWSRRRA